MEEMVAYIFRSLRTSESSIKAIRRILRNQACVNRSIATFTMLMAVYVVLAEINNRDQNREIEKLRIELEELKRSEGD